MIEKHHKHDKEKRYRTPTVKTLFLLSSPIANSTGMIVDDPAIEPALTEGNNIWDEDEDEEEEKNTEQRVTFDSDP